MGKFAGVYNIVGGEQMLICVVQPTNDYPKFQVSTEVNDVPVSIILDVVASESVKKKLTHKEVKTLAVDFIEQVTMENLLELRRTIVLELSKQGEALPAEV